MAKKIEIELDVQGNVVESTKNLRAMKQELKTLDVGTAEFKKLYNQIDDLEDKIKSAKNKSSDWVDSLENAGGPLGMVGAAINKVKVATVSWGAALKATGIGLLVSLIGGLVAAFSQTEGSMKKLQPILIAFEQIFGGIVEALQPVIDGLADLALDLMPHITKAFKIAYSAMSSFLQGIGKIGSALVKFFKGDFKGAWEDAKSSVTGFVDRYEEAEKRFDIGAKKMTKTQKENAAKAKELAEKALQEKLKQMEAADKIDEAKLAKMKADALALAKTEQEKLDVEILYAKKSYELKKKELEDKQKLYKKGTVEYKDFMAQLINLDAEYENTKTANDEKQKQINLNKQKEYFTKQKAIYDANQSTKERDQATADEKELQALDLQLKKGQIKQYEYNIKLYELKKKQLEDKQAMLNEDEAKEKAYYDDLYAKNKIDKENYENQILEIQKRYGDKRFETLKAQGEVEYTNAVNLAQMLVETKEYEKDAIIALEEAKISALGTLGNILTQLAGQNKTIAILGLAVTQGAAIADILTKYFRTKAQLMAQGAIYKSMIPNPVTAAIGIAGQAAVTAGQTANTIGMAAGLAGVASAVAQGIAQINGAGGGGAAPGGGGAGAGGGENSAGNLGRNYGSGGMVNGPLHANGGVPITAEGGEAIMTRGAVTMFAPLLSAMNQMGGGKSFGTQLYTRPDRANVNTPQKDQTPIIMKTYVVSNELTTEAEKQAKLKDLSTL